MIIDDMKAIDIHRRARGKIGVFPTINVRNEEELAQIYLPGSIPPSRAIQEDPSRSFELSGKGNRIAVVTDGSSILGLGNVGARASLPVLEGKCLLYKIFADIDAIPICLDSQSNSDILSACRLFSPSFGAIALDDIASPRALTILRELRSKLAIPVFCDDEQGTAVLVLAALKNALEVAGKKLDEAKIVLCGAGSSGIASLHLLLKAGLKNIVVLNSSGILGPGNETMDHIQEEYAAQTNPEGLSGGMEDAIKGADVFIGLSTGGVLNRDLIRMMAEDPIILALALPEPEISPEEARAAGARLVGTGLYEYPNALTNLHAFPGIMRGLLDVNATMVTDGMLLTAADALASVIDRRRLSAKHFMPDVFCDEVAPRVAEAIAQKAIEEGTARNTFPAGAIYERTWQRIWGNGGHRKF